MEKYDHTMCYLGAVPHFDRDSLLQICQDIVDRHELAPIRDQIFESNDFDDFVNRLRGNEVVIVPLLSGLAIKKGVGVTIQFFINERTISDRAGMVVSIDTTKTRALSNTFIATNHDGSNWYKLIAKVASRISRGRVLKSAKAKKMKRAQHAKHGLVDAWIGKEGTAEYLAQAHVWGNMAIKPEANAIAQLPDDDLKKASPNTIRAIFGSRSKCAQWLNEVYKTKES